VQNNAEPPGLWEEKDNHNYNCKEEDSETDKLRLGEKFKRKAG
jgi:hypothetical protein